MFLCGKAQEQALLRALKTPYCERCHQRLEHESRGTSRFSVEKYLPAGGLFQLAPLRGPSLKCHRPRASSPGFPLTLGHHVLNPTGTLEATQWLKDESNTSLAPPLKKLGRGPCHLSPAPAPSVSVLRAPQPRNPETLPQFQPSVCSAPTPTPASEGRVRSTPS